MSKATNKTLLICNVVLAVLFIAVCFVACNHTTKWYPIIEGTYRATAKKTTLHSDVEAELIISAIDENAYASASGINTVQDNSPQKKNAYYKIQLAVFGEEEEIIGFDNLKAQVDDPNYERYYMDAHGSMFVVKSSDSKTKYEITIVRNECVFYEFVFEAR